MLSWLESLAAANELTWRTLALRLAMAALAGMIVAGIYQTTQRRLQGTVSLVTTLVLLTILVAMTTIVIGDSVARAFGLVGALSIVRFRTVVEDTRDTSFVIFAVVVGMAMGAGRFDVCLVGIPTVAVAALVMNQMTVSSEAGSLERRLKVRVSAGHDPESLVAAAFRERLVRWRLVSIVSARQGAALDLAYRVRLRGIEAMIPLVKAVNGLEGVQSVELEEI